MALKFVIAKVIPDEASLHTVEPRGERSGMSFISKVCTGIHGPGPQPLIPLTLTVYVPGASPVRSIELSLVAVVASTIGTSQE